MAPFTVVGISGSLRKASTNTGLLRYARDHAPQSLRIELADITDIPLFNADLEAAGRPQAVVDLAEQIAGADALLLACPEYNYCLAPALKNALDWVSRVPNKQGQNAILAEKPTAIMGAGGGMGTSRAQYQLRQMCVYLNLLPLNKPELFVNAFSGAFDAEGSLIAPDIQQQVDGLLTSFAAWIKRLHI